MSAAPSPALQPPAAAVHDVSSSPASSRALGLFVYGLLLLAAIAVGVLLEELGPPWVRALFGMLSVNSPASVVALFAAGLAAVVIHEAGHLLAATFFDFEILAISLGPLRVQWLHGKYAVHFSAKRFFAGSVSVIPKTMDDWRRRSMVVAAAGPAATFWTSMAACVAAALSHSGGFLAAFWSALAVINFFIFMLGMIPNRPNAAARNDLTVFWLLLRNGAEARDLELTYLIGQLKLRAIRPSAYPEPLMDRLATGRPSRRADTNVLVSRTMADWALDFGDTRMADLWDRRAVEHSQHSDPRMRNSALAASACLDVMVRADLHSARAKFDQVDLGELFPPCFAHRARAVRLLAFDLPKLAPAEIIRAQYALPAGLPYYDFERMQLEKIHLLSLHSMP
jgi:hypothetical protein